jgi:hypothetical protein
MCGVATQSIIACGAIVAQGNVGKELSPQQFIGEPMGVNHFDFVPITTNEKLAIAIVFLSCGP